MNFSESGLSIFDIGLARELIIIVILLMTVLRGLFPLLAFAGLLAIEMALVFLRFGDAGLWRSVTRAWIEDVDNDLE